MTETFRTNDHALILAALDDLRIGFALTDGEKVILVNEALCAITGCDQGELLGLPHPLALIHPAEQPVLADRLRRRLAGELVPDHYRSTVVHKSGTSVAVDMALKIAAGEERHLIVLVKEIDANDLSEESVREIRDTLLYALSHELRTPLTAMLGYARTLAERGESMSEEDRAEFRLGVLDQGNRLERRLNDLLDVERLTRADFDPTSPPTNVLAVIERVLSELNLARSHMITVDVPPMVVHIDEAMLERILENLLSNALKHTPEGTQIWARAHAERDGILLRVEDAGPGVDEKHRLNIFEPFQQGDAVPLHAPGVGLGLAIVARLARLHRGDAWVEDRDGGGASFCVYLKARRA